MVVKRLILGSTNPGKLQEWKRLLKGIEVISILEVGNFPEPEETGSTFRQNARIKASHYSLLTKEYVFSEDGGYEIDALGGLPGVKSRRILPGGKEGTDEQLIEYVLGKLKGVSKKRRGVKLSFSAALSDPAGKIIFEGGNFLSGIVADKPGPVRIPGYPFREIHLLPELGKTYAELTEEEHEKYNHKKSVAQRLIKFLLE